MAGSMKLAPLVALEDGCLGCGAVESPPLGPYGGVRGGGLAASAWLVWARQMARLHAACVRSGDPSPAAAVQGDA